MPWFVIYKQIIDLAFSYIIWILIRDTWLSVFSSVATIIDF